NVGIDVVDDVEEAGRQHAEEDDGGERIEPLVEVGPRARPCRFDGWCLQSGVGHRSSPEMRLTLTFARLVYRAMTALWQLDQGPPPSPGIGVRQAVVEVDDGRPAAQPH